MRNQQERRSGKFIVPIPPARGSVAPSITVLDSDNEVETRLDYSESSFTIILFLRGTWCLYCAQQLRALQDHLNRLEAVGIRIACISPEPVATLAAYKRKTGMSIPMFSDPKRTASKAFGVHYWLRYDGFNLAHPALFIIGQTGETLVSYVSKSMSDLPVGHLLDKFLSFLNQAEVETSDAQQ